METFEFQLRSETRVLADLRRQLLAWLVEAGVAEELRFDIVLGTHEVAANAIEYAEPHGEPGSVRVGRVEDVVTVEVRDSGPWKADHRHDVERGRGLELVEATVESLLIETNHNGTMLLLTYRLIDSGHPA